MKRSTIIALIILIVVSAIGSGVYYKKVYEPKLENATATGELYTVNKDANGKKTLVCSEFGFSLYTQGKKVLLDYEGQENEFTGWSERIADETPKMYYGDFDGDDEDELLIRALESVDERNQNVYCIYILNISKGDDGKYKYDVSYGGRSSWVTQFNDSVNIEMRQLLNCPKRLQFSMCSKGSVVTYDSKTGVALDGYPGYAKALQNENGGYYTMESWDRGSGIYNIDEEKNEIRVELPIYITYKDTDTVQKAGYINMRMGFSGNDLQIVNGTVYFKAYDEYSITDPVSPVNNHITDWEDIITNTSTFTQNDKKISNLSVTLSVTAGEYSQDLSKISNDIRLIKKMVITNDTIKFYAKDGYYFDENITKGRKFTIILKDEKDKDYDISAVGTIEKDGNDNVLSITLDNKFYEYELQDVKIDIGK